MANLEGVDLKDLDASFGGFPTEANDDYYKKILNHNPVQSVLKKSGVDLDDLDAAFGQSKPSETKTEITVRPVGSKASPLQASNNTERGWGDTFKDAGSGIKQGLQDVVNTGAGLIGYADEKLMGEAGKARNADFQRRLEEERASLPTDNTAFDVGRIGGQVLATAPLAPILPEMAAMRAIPYVGKLASSVARGGMSGGMFGAATNSVNDEGLASNVGTNAAYGAMAGPLVEGGVKVAGKSISKLKDAIEAIRINNAVKNTGIAPEAARNTLARLTDAGFTPAQAEAELRRIGPNATLADLTPSLTTEAGGLASRGAEATDLLKGRFGERAAKANTVAHDIMETRLGIKPDYEVEKAAAKAERQRLTKSDYDAAKNSRMALDAQPVVDKIDNALEHAVGSEAAELKTARSYLHNPNGDIKIDTKPLLKARQGLDDRLDKLKKEGTSQASATYRAVSEVRDELDKVLKTNPDLAIADAKYAKLAQDFGGIDLGRKAITNTGNYENFAREFNKASSEKQEYMRKGLRIQIGDMMEKATRGELSEAQRLFGKSTNNRKIIRLAFGQDGDQVLNELEREAAQRAVEHSVKLNSLTAERRAVQERPEYGGNRGESGALAGVAQGMMADVVTGTPGMATGIGAAKSVIGRLKDKINKERIENTVKGTADLLSRQAQHGRGQALDALKRVERVSGRNNSKLPINDGVITMATRAATPAGIPAVKRLKALTDEFRGVEK